MLLVDNQIQSLAIEQGMLEPFSEQVLGMASYGLTSAGYDLRLGPVAKVYKNTFNQVIDIADFKEQELFDVIDAEKLQQNYICIPPHGYILGYSLEYIRMPGWLKGRCVGKSTYARAGVIVNTTPLEPGWEGHLTIEIGNVTPCPVKVYVGRGIAQLEFEQLAGTPTCNYEQKQGKYQRQESAPIAPRAQ